MLFLGLFTTPFGFPGTLVILLSTGIYCCVSGFQSIGCKAFVSLAFLSVLAESLEFYMGIAGAKRFSVTRRGLIAALTGGIVGALLMTPLLKGLGILIGAFMGGFTGLFVIEIISERSLKPSARASPRAILGGVTGVLIKGILALVMVAIVLSAIYS